MEKREILTKYPGARVTRLVNRKDILDEIREAVRDRSGKTYVFYITASGGTGKTFLAREVLRCCREDEEWAVPDLLVAKEEVDFYHHQTHSQEGFMIALLEALGPGPGFFGAYREQYENLKKVKYDLRGALSELRREQERLVEAFLEGFAEMTGQRRPVIVLDTVERLVHLPDRLQEALGLEWGGEFGVWDWLFNTWLPNLRNCVVLICGRPREQFTADLRRALQDHDHIRLVEHTLEDFQEEDETLDYFRAVEEQAKKEGDGEALRRLESIPEETRRVIHHLAGGHPITLALIIDYFLVTGRLIEAAKTPLEEARRKSDAELRELRDQVEADVVRLLQEMGRPADEAIRAMAWAPKGMDAELLARMIGIEEGEAKVLLQALAGLSFVKIRPANQRAFLHDEMYALMEKHVLGPLPQKHGQEVRGIILDYYEQKIEEARAEVARLGQMEREEITLDWLGIEITAPGPPRDPAALLDAQNHLYDLLVEELYYRLQRDPLSGFAAYCEYSEEAFLAYDASLDMRLRDELFDFVNKVFKKQEVSRGLKRGFVEADAAMRWIRRYVYGGQYDRASTVIDSLRTSHRDLLDRGGPLAWAALDVWAGWVAAYRGEELDQAEKNLQEAIERLRRFQPKEDFEKHRRQLLLTRAHNTLGYLLRVQGRYGEARDVYRASLPFWRGLKLEAEHANTLNNLAWAEAEAGNLGRAKRYCQDGLKLRQKLSHRYPWALSLNTFGLIEVKDDQPHRGRVHCGQALVIFRDLGMPRGIGLAYIALAEAYRRCADTPEVYSPPQKAQLLGIAADLADQAVEIFRHEVLEPLRLVEALLELGCVYRNLARLRCEHPKAVGDSLEDLIQKAEDALRETAELAADSFPYRQVDALVNLAWLYFWVEMEESKVEQVLEEALAPIPEEYYFTKGGPPAVERPNTTFWVQMGKAELLRGLLALKAYRSEPRMPGGVRDEGLWKQVTEHFALALAYDNLFAEAFRDLRRAKDTMYENLNGINVEELRALYRVVDETAQKYQFEKPPAMLTFLEDYFGRPEELEA